jgi:hypothetical protein
MKKVLITPGVMLKQHGHLLIVDREGAPGQRECDAALQNLDMWINLLDQASLAAVGQNLAATQDGGLAGFQEQVIASARQLLSQIEPLRSAAKGETGNLHSLVRGRHLHINRFMRKAAKISSVVYCVGCELVFSLFNRCRRR